MPDTPFESNFQRILREKKLSFSQSVYPFLREHKTSLALFVAALTPLLTYSALSTYNQAQSQWVLYTHEKQQEASIKKQREEYQKLIEKQSMQQENTNDDANVQKRKALGDYTLHIFLVKSPTLQTSDVSALIQKLKDKDKKAITSLYYLNTFYQKWAEHYNIADFHLELKFHGPYNLDTLEQVGDMAQFWGKDPFATTRLQDSFNNLLTGNNIKLTDKDIAIFLYFDDSFTENSLIAEDRFYEHKKFRSFADEITGKAYINVYSLNQIFAGKVTEIVAHEVLHLFGANDKYEESESVTRICSERGRGDLELKPILPQKTADIMCMYVEKEGDEFVRGSFAMETLTINKLSAEEIGWKD